MSKNNYIIIAIVSSALATFSTISFASDHTQQIASISEKIHSLQAQLDATNNKIAQLCDSTTKKNANSQIDVSKIHQTANGRH